MNIPNRSAAFGLAARLTLLGTCIALFDFTSMAGPLIDSYWPVQDGDQKLFIYPGARALTMTVADWGGGSFVIDEEFGDVSQSLECRVDQTGVYLSGVKVGWIHVSFSPDVRLVDENTLQNGGTLKTDTTVSQSGISYPATFTIQVRKVAKVRVPAGTFIDCRSIVASERAVVPGRGVVQAKALTAFLAPDLGIIKTAVGAGRWASLVNGTVGGNAVGDPSYARITLVTDNGGKVAPDVNGRVLRIGQTYTVRAKPRPGYTFGGWFDFFGDTISTDPIYRFTMQQNLYLEANFYGP